MSHSNENHVGIYTYYCALRRNTPLFSIAFPCIERKHFSCFVVYVFINVLLYAHLGKCVRHTLYSYNPHIYTAHAAHLQWENRTKDKLNHNFPLFFFGIISAMFFQTKTLVCLGNSSESVTVASFQFELWPRKYRVPPCIQIEINRFIILTRANWNLFLYNLNRAFYKWKIFKEFRGKFFFPIFAYN